MLVERRDYFTWGPRGALVPFNGAKCNGVTQDDPGHADNPDAVEGAHGSVALPDVHQLGQVAIQGKTHQESDCQTYAGT